MAFIAYQDKRMAVRALRLQCRRGSVLGGMASLGSMLFFGGGGGDKKQPSSEKEANDVADAELVERCLITAAQPENLDPEQQDDEASEGIFIKWRKNRLKQEKMVRKILLIFNEWIG